MSGQDELNREAYTALSDQNAPETWIIAAPENLEALFWAITRVLKKGKTVEVAIKEVDRPSTTTP